MCHFIVPPIMNLDFLILIFSLYRFPLGKERKGSQGTPLKPRQGSCPCTPPLTGTKVESQGTPLKPRQGPSPCTLLAPRDFYHRGPYDTVFHFVALAVDFGYGVGVVVAFAVVVEG